MEYKSFMEALKGNQHKLDKNKNGKLDAHDFKLLRKEEEELDEAYGVNLGSRPVSGQKEYQGKEIKSFHPNKEKEAREYAKKHGYVVKKKELPKGSSNITHTWDIHKEEADLSEEHIVHVDDGSKYGDQPHKKDADHVMAGVKKHNGKFDGHSDKGAYFKFNSKSDAEGFVRHVKAAPHKTVYADLHEEIEGLDEADVQARADYKLDKSGRKYHKQIHFKDGSNDEANEKNEVREATQYGLPSHSHAHVMKKIKSGDWEATHDIKAGRHLEIIDHSKGGKRKTIHVKEEFNVNEEMTDTQKSERERIVKGMKKNIAGFKAKYGERAKDVMYATATKMAMKEESELEEQAPVAPSLVKHRIGVTVSDPNATSVTARKEKVQKFVRVTHSDNKEGAQKVGEKHFKKKGYVVHDSWHAGMVNEEVELDESVKIVDRDSDLDQEHFKLHVNGKPVHFVHHNYENSHASDSKDDIHYQVKKQLKHLSPQHQKAVTNAVHASYRIKEETDLEEGYVVRYNNPKSDKHGSERHFDDQASAQKHADRGNSVDKIGGKYTVHKTNEKGHDMKEEVELDEADQRIKASDVKSAIKNVKQASAHTKKMIKANPTEKMPHGMSRHAAYSEEVELDEAVESGNKGYGYHGQHESDIADKKYSAMHAKVKKVAGEAGHLRDAKKPNVMVKHYLDSRHGRHLAGNEHDHEYIKKDFGKFKKSYKESDFAKESVGFDEEGNLMAEKLTYAQFMEQLLEYTPGPGGVTRVQGRSYGAQYHDPEGDDDADDKPKKKAEPAVKRGRGRPAGSKSGANQKVTSGKSYGGIATHSLHLPSSNR